MPVHHFVNDQALAARGLHNLWGYQPIGWFAPHSGYATADGPSTVTEFKEMVRRLHAAGLEVILDVVYNHTAESHQLGPHLSLRGIDNPAYYRLDVHDRRRYLDYTGTGNTVNADHPAVQRAIVDSLRHWVTRYHVDGFRFDLAATLGRRHELFDPATPLFHLINQDPVLATVKLIAEPWDVGPGGYQLGGFPAGWGEWNDRFRDTVRDFWRGAERTVPDLATRLTASADVFLAGGRRPPASSMNYVTSHDGFTLADLVAYDRKHNDRNGEGSTDGTDNNRSWNTGIEGPSDDTAILALRRRRRRSLLATLLVSQGVPMLLGGDELGRSQEGTTTRTPTTTRPPGTTGRAADPGFVDFARRLVALRRANPVLRRRTWLTGIPAGGPDSQDVTWLDRGGDADDPGGVDRGRHPGRGHGAQRRRAATARPRSRPARRRLGHGDRQRLGHTGRHDRRRPSGRWRGCGPSWSTPPVTNRPTLAPGWRTGTVVTLEAVCHDGAAQTGRLPGRRVVVKVLFATAELAPLVRVGGPVVRSRRAGAPAPRRGHRGHRGAARLRHL